MESRQFSLDNGRPGDERGFIHKKLLKFALPVASGLVGGLFKTKSRPTLPEGVGTRPSQFTDAQKEFAKAQKFGDNGALQFKGAAPGDGCFPGFRRPPGGGRCTLFLGDRPGPDGDLALGEPVMGQYGAGVVPGNRIVDRAVCGRGMQLGNDGVCYNKSQISNKQRMWPAERRPLLTGGDLNAIAIATRSAKRLESATKRLQKMGMMKKPTRRASSTQHSRLLEAHVTK